MLVENIVNTLNNYVAHNDFNGFYDYLMDILKNSNELKCKLIVETFLNNLNFDKYYDMYAPVVISTLEKELGSRKTINFDSYKKHEEVEENKNIINKELIPIINNLGEYLANKDLKSFRTSLVYLINEVTEISELKAILSSVGRAIETIKNDKPTYEESKKIFGEIRNTSPLWQEELDNLKKFINNRGFNVIDTNDSIKK